MITMIKPFPLNTIYRDERLLFYLRTHPEWYRYLFRYPDGLNAFIHQAREELKLTPYHRLERFKSQISLFSLLSEYMKRG